MLSRLVALAALATSQVVSATQGLVQTPLGAVQGIVLDNAIVYEGVPYATPPVGNLRWKSPEPVQPWAPNTLQATQDPPGCIQRCWDDEPPHICPATVSEDCLYMNIWTPLDNVTTPIPRPVILFIHGGNFHDGYAGGRDANGGLLYDGAQYVEDTGAIVVVINYRLGALGFAYLSDSVGINGNYGLQDQVLAMEWVQSYISYFGGDPTRVTLMGQSAGAMSISVHLSRPQTAGLYVGAIMHSNPHAESYRDPSSALGLALAFSNFTGCPSSAFNLQAVADCWYNLTSDQILAAQVQAEVDLVADLSNILQVVVNWSPTIGTEYVPQRPLEAFQNGNVIDVPFMIGTTANETVIFVYEAIDFAMDQSMYDLAAIVLFGYDNWVASTQYYPLPDPLPEDFRVYCSYLLTDGLFVCPTRNASEALMVAQPYRKSKIYNWQYSHLLNAAALIWGSNFTECTGPNGVCHGSDLPMWWHPMNPLFQYTDEENALAVQMHYYWANFAYTGNPNEGPFANSIPVVWPSYNATTRQTLNFEVASMGGVTVIEDLKAVNCAWWDNVVGYDVY